MSIFLQFFFNGLIAGAMYALVASGFSLIYATNRFVHFAHGMMVTMAAYALYSFFVLLSFPFWISTLLAILFAGGIGVLSFLLVYRPLKKRKASAAILLIASLALMIFLENIPLFFFGPAVKTLGVVKAQAGINIFGASVTPLQIGIIITSLIVLGLLWVFVHYSKQGKIMRAVADNPELASTSGINVERVHIASFFVGSLIAGVAGVLIALEQNITPLMGTMFIIKGFTAAVIGGVMSIPGAMLGGYLLGVVENVGIIWLPSGYKEAITFVLLLFFLIIRPQGILGIKRRMR